MSRESQAHSTRLKKKAETKSAELSNELKSWGNFKEDQLPVEKLAELAPIAQKIIDRVGW